MISLGLIGLMAGGGALYLYYMGTPSSRDCMKCKYCSDPYSSFPNCTADGERTTHKGKYFDPYYKPNIKEKMEQMKKNNETLYCDSFEYR